MYPFPLIALLSLLSLLYVHTHTHTHTHTQAAAAKSHELQPKHKPDLGAGAAPRRSKEPSKPLLANERHRAASAFTMASSAPAAACKSFVCVYV